MKATAIDDRTLDEVNRLFDRFRIERLNVAYYGCRNELFELRERNLQIASAGLGGIALVILLASGTDWARYVGAGLAGLGAVLTTVQPFLGWKEKARETNYLYRAHHQIFTQMESVLTRIRRIGVVTDELVGASSETIAAFERLQAMDEPHPDEALKNRLNKDVQAEFPPDCVWKNF